MNMEICELDQNDSINNKLLQLSIQNQNQSQNDFLEYEEFIDYFGYIKKKTHKFTKTLLKLNKLNISIVNQLHSIFKSIMDVLNNKYLSIKPYSSEYIYNLDLINEFYSKINNNKLTNFLKNINDTIEFNFDNKIKMLYAKLTNGEYTYENLLELNHLKEVITNYDNFESLNDYLNPIYLEYLNIYSYTYKLVMNRLSESSHYITISEKNNIIENIKTIRLLFNPLKSYISKFDEEIYTSKMETEKENKN
jgi:hypothetical protein